MNTNLWNGYWKGRKPLGDDHQRARNVISPSGGIFRGKFPSRKNGRMIEHEGQPKKIQYPDGARVRRYTPDFEATLTSGKSLWIEVKPSEFLRRDDIQHKLNCVSEQMARIQQGFVILTDDVLRREPRQSNARTIFHRAERIRPTDARVKTVLAQCAGTLPASLARTTELLARHGLEPYGLLMAGLISCDMDSPLSPQTQMTMSEEADDGWFWIAQEHGF